jgi:hypothetical protein
MLKTYEALYQKNDFNNALKYLRDNSSEIPQELWHYNLGLVYAKLGSFPLARYHFLMAGKAGLQLESLRQNEKLIVEKLDLASVEKPLNASDYIYKGVTFLSQGELTSLCLIVLFTGLLSLRKKLNMARLAVIIVAMSIPLTLGFLVKQWPEAIVIQDDRVAEGPSGIFAALTDIPAGVKVVTKGEGDWREILYPSRYKGWIRKNSIKELESL